MKRHILFAAVLILALGTFSVARADRMGYDPTIDYGSYLKIDRYLNIEVWTDHDDYYQGDNVQFSFKTNEDCFVVVYNIDSRGDVHILYPAGPNDDMRVQGGRIYTVPSTNDDYDLTVQGPEGVEYLQAVASREPFDLNDWDDNLYCNDDPYDFMDYINTTFLGCNSDCHRSYDLTSFMVKQWDDYYFRPVYNYDRPYWSYAGSVYVDYPFGASIYIDGVYWGCAPLFIPRIYYGWHWVTVYDHSGYCWEDRIQVVRRKSVVLNDTVIRTKASVHSRYRDVQNTGYRDPVKSGYTDYNKQIVRKREIQATRQSSPQGSATRMQTESRSGTRYNDQTTTSGRTRGTDQTQQRSTEPRGTYERGSRSTRSGSDTNNTRQGSTRSTTRRPAGETRSTQKRSSGSRSIESSSRRSSESPSRSTGSGQRSTQRSQARSQPRSEPSSPPSVRSSGQERQSSGSSSGSQSRGGGSSSEARQRR